MSKTSFSASVELGGCRWSSAVLSRCVVSDRERDGVDCLLRVDAVQGGPEDEVGVCVDDELVVRELGDDSLPRRRHRN
jgi:hypothetical protein